MTTRPETDAAAAGCRAGLRTTATLMPELHHKIQIPAKPQRVWNALLDFPGYSKWNPFVAVRGTVGNANRIEWSFGRPQGTRRVCVEGLITVRDEPHILTWCLGVSRVFTLEESYSLIAIQGGTVLGHSIRCRGVMVALLAPLIRRRLRKILSAGDHGLQHYLSPILTVHRGHPRPPDARHISKKSRPRLR